MPGTLSQGLWTSGNEALGACGCVHGEGETEKRGRPPKDAQSLLLRSLSTLMALLHSALGYKSLCEYKDVSSQLLGIVEQ